MKICAFACCMSVLCISCAFFSDKSVMESVVDFFQDVVSRT
jgi:hypothetical protein